MLPPEETTARTLLPRFSCPIALFSFAQEVETAMSVQKKDPSQRVRNTGRTVIPSRVRFTGRASTPGVDLSNTPFRAVSRRHGFVGRRGVWQRRAQKSADVERRKQTVTPGEHRLAAQTPPPETIPHAGQLYPCRTAAPRAGKHRPKRLIFIVPAV